MLLASLGMYISPAPIAMASRTLWQELSRRLRQEGLQAPENLDETIRHDDAWIRSDLLFSQTCGYPFIQHLRGKVQLIASPVYDLVGCDGPLMCSFIIVNSNSPARSLNDLRGSRVAVNDLGSNSGYNLLRASVAPHAIDGHFFSSVVETGSHQASIDAISSRAADVAAIDCVTFGNTLRFEPDRVGHVRVLAETMKVPGLPFITSASTSADDLRVLRRVLAETITDPAHRDVCDTLSLAGIEFLDDADYEVLAELQKTAERQNYPRIA